MDNEYGTIFLEDEFGNEKEYEHLDTFELNNNYYAAFIDIDEEELELFKVEKENDEDVFIRIEDEYELNMVYEEFKFRNDDLYDFE